MRSPGCLPLSRGAESEVVQRDSAVDTGLQVSAPLRVVDVTTDRLLVVCLPHGQQGLPRKTFLLDVCHMGRRTRVCRRRNMRYSPHSPLVSSLGMMRTLECGHLTPPLVTPYSVQ